MHLCRFGARVVATASGLEVMFVAIEGVGECDRLQGIRGVKSSIPSGS